MNKHFQCLDIRYETYINLKIVDLIVGEDVGIGRGYESTTKMMVWSDPTKTNRYIERDDSVID